MSVRVHVYECVCECDSAYVCMCVSGDVYESICEYKSECMFYKQRC